MNSGEQIQFVLKAMETKDGEALAAIFLAPSYLSGLSERHHGEFKKQYFAKAVPAAWKAGEDFEFIVECWTAALNVADRVIGELGDSNKIQRIEAAQARSLAAEAALGGN